MLIFSAPLRVAASHPCLPGHFPGRPIVPAVVLLEEVLKVLRAKLGNVRTTHVFTAKFAAPVLPEQDVVLHLEADPETGRARFRCEVDGKIATQGEIGFAAA